MDFVKNIINEVENLKSQTKYNEALKLLENHISSYNNDYRLYEEIADIYLYEWKNIKAKKAVDFALKINPESPTWNYLKWFILLANNKVLESVEFLEKSNELMPNNAEVLRNLWWAYCSLWEEIKWIFILKRSLNLSPWDELILEDLAMALITNWNIKEWNSILTKIWKKQITA